MKINRLWSIGLAFLLVSSAIAEGNKFWIDLSRDREFHYGSVPISAVQGDLDNDGVMDVVVGTAQSAFTYPGKCFILWGGTEYQEIYEIVGDNTVIAIEDLDNNGFKDIICRERTFYNQGNRTFSFAEDDGYWPDSKFADLNGDGILDSVTRSFWINGSDESIQEFSIHPQYFEIIDMNNDGRLDIICKNTTSPRFFWYENTGGELLFSDAIILDEENVTVPLKVMDYDYDGDDDLFVIHQGITGFLVNNSGLLPLSFSPLFDVVPEGYASTPRIVDLDFDGDWDMFGYNGNERRFFVVEQIGYRTLEYEFHWISDEVTLSYWGGFFLYQHAGETYYYYRILNAPGSSQLGGIYRTQIDVQAENAVSVDWNLLQ